MKKQDKNMRPIKNQDVLRMSNQESNRITRESLQIALIYLMDEKPFDKITITELVEKAGVSRTAFYRNFASKEELLGDICNGVMQSLQQSLRSRQFIDTPQAWYAQWFQMIKDNETLVRLLMKAHLFEDTLGERGSFFEMAFSANSIEQHYAFVAIEGALLCTVRRWIAGGMQESVSLMAEICAKLHYHILTESTSSLKENSGDT